jgi:hypothetical protein
MRTPWTDLLRRFGYDPAVDIDECDEDDWRFDSWFNVPPVVEEARMRQREQHTGSHRGRQRTDSDRSSDF